MQTYKDFRPTQFDTSGLGCDDRQDWLVAPVGRNRDSECLDESNFARVLKDLGGESDTVEVHRFGHWANGWFEIILVDPSREPEVTVLEMTLSGYPVLDEDDLSARESEAAQEAWTHTSIKERIALCKRGRVSILAARREYPPFDDNGSIQEALLGH